MKKAVKSSMILHENPCIFRNRHKVTHFYIKIHINIRMSSYDDLEMIKMSMDFGRIILVFLNCIVIVLIYFSLKV